MCIKIGILFMLIVITPQLDMKFEVKFYFFNIKTGKNLN